MKAARRRRRAESLKRRVASSIDNYLPRCTVFGCGQPTQRASKQGLSPFLCRKHVLHRQRHGSSWCPSPKGKILRPFTDAAEIFIKKHNQDSYVASALLGMQGLMRDSGEVIRATNLRGLTAWRRARIALARLRDAEVSPTRLLAIVVAVHALIEETPAEVHRITDWRVVAIAKAAHRLASGYHLVWDMKEADGRRYRSELHAYPRSSGAILRIIGGWLEREAEFVVDRHLQDFLKFKAERKSASRSSATLIAAK